MNLKLSFRKQRTKGFGVMIAYKPLNGPKMIRRVIGDIENACLIARDRAETLRGERENGI